MKRATCERSWQAEAVEDGRLAGVDRASFERHATSCATCAREARFLATLRQTALQLPKVASTPLERRRLRNDLLRRANEQSTRTPLTLPRWFIGFGLGLAMVAITLFAWTRRSTNLTEIPRAPTYRMSTSPEASWRPLSQDATVKLLLERGRYELSVDKLERGQRFLLALPDGEIEVQGTRFVVDVDGSRTDSVVVDEGRVALRLRDRPEIVLRAGDSWTGATLGSNASGATLPETEPSAIATAPPAPRASSRSPRKRDPASEIEEGASAAGASSVERSDASPSDFAQAMSVFSAGDYGRAEQRLLTFERNHPDDARVEDAMFLRAVARARRGDAVGARAVALEYLSRYPKGLRRSEAEKMIR